MKIYRWWSKALMQYGSGTIFAIGNTIEEAREVAASGFHEILEEECRFIWNDDFDEDDMIAMDALLWQLEQDIAGEPYVDIYFYLKGSE